MAFLALLGVTFTPSDPLRIESKASLGAWTLRVGKFKGIPFSCSYFASSLIEEADTCNSSGGKSLLTGRTVEQCQAGMGDCSVVDGWSNRNRLDKTRPSVPTQYLSPEKMIQHPPVTGPGFKMCSALRRQDNT